MPKMDGMGCGCGGSLLYTDGTACGCLGCHLDQSADGMQEARP
jgi:hypothetical protein